MEEILYGCAETPQNVRSPGFIEAASGFSGSSTELQANDSHAHGFHFFNRVFKQHGM